MNNLLIFFAIPFAVIVISLALQKLLRCPFLVAAIIYAIISYITAFLTCVICRFLNSQNEQCQCNNNNDNNNNNDDNQVVGVNGVSARINVIPNNNGNTGTINGCYRRR